MDQLSLGVMGRSRKENERRLAIHPLHIGRIAADLRERIYLERGYGETLRRLRRAARAERRRAFGPVPSSSRIAMSSCSLSRRPPTSRTCATGQVLWGWPHCVQDEEITQLSIDRRLTLIAFEAMNYWAADGSFSLHVFHKNNEMAGYCSVLHALELAGLTGAYGRRLRAAVISFGATARGAVTALNAHGVERRRRTDASCHQRGSLADPLGAHACTSNWTTMTRAAATCCAKAAGCPWRRSSPSTTSWSTASCRIPMRR